MARKVFISFLGTNNYVQTHYELNGKKSEPVRFIQEALINFICKDWSENDKILIFFTEDSKNKNWLDNGHKTDIKEETIGLKSCLEKYNLFKIVEGHTIKDGFSINEIWDIFNVVYEQLYEEDEIYFDVTHAFRSIPIFSTILFDFSHTMKNTNVKSILYGAFEKLGPAFKIKGMDLDERIAPIIDLTSLINLQQTISAANDYKKFGKVSCISKDKKSTNKNLTTDDEKKSKNALMVLESQLSNFDNYIATCRMKKIRDGKYAKEIINRFDYALKNNSISAPEKTLLESIKEDIVNKFSSEEDDKNINAAIDWAYKYKMLQQAYTLAQENTISLVIKLLKDKNPYNNDSNLKEKEKIKKFREYIGSILGINNKDINDKNFKGCLKEHEEYRDELLNNSKIKDIRAIYKKLGDNRNNINHAKGDKKAEEFEKEFKDYYKILDIINEL